MEFSIVVTSMGRLEQLRESLPACAGQPHAECIVVDYSCPQASGAWAEREYPQVRVVRVPGEETFNAARARNAGAAIARGRQLVFVDADVICPPDFTARLRSLIGPRVFLRVEPVVPDLWGTVAVAREDFERAGRYDEVMQDWGGEDDDLYARLQLTGSAMRTMPASWFRWQTHGDEERVRHHELKDLRLCRLINVAYTQAKIDALRLSGRAAPADERARLYAAIRQAVLGAGLQPGATVAIDIALPARHVLGVDIDTRLRYAVRCATQGHGLK